MFSGDQGAQNAAVHPFANRAEHRGEGGQRPLRRGGVAAGEVQPGEGVGGVRRGRSAQPGQDVGRLPQVAGPAQQLGLDQHHSVGEHGRSTLGQPGRCPQGGACTLPVPAVGATKRIQRDRGELDVRFGCDGLDLGDPPEPPVDAFGLAPVERHPGEREIRGDGLRRCRPARFGRALDCRLRLGLRSVEITTLGQQQGQL